MTERYTWACPTKGCGFVTAQPALIKEVAHKCRLNRDRLVTLRRRP